MFLNLYAEQAKIEKKAEAVWIQEMKQKEAEQASAKKSKKQASVVPFNTGSGEENKAEDNQDELGEIKGASG